MVKIPGVIKTTAWAAIVSAATVDLSTATGNSLHITGSTGPITSFGTVDEGVIFELIFDSTPTITYNATSLKLPGSANIVATAGDTMVLRSEGSGNWKCVAYTRINGKALVETVPNKFGGDGSDGAIAWALSVTGSDNTYIVKNYTSFAPGANTVTIVPVGCILHIKVQWNCDLTNTIFDFSWKWWQGGNGGAAQSTITTGWITWGAGWIGIGLIHQVKGWPAWIAGSVNVAWTGWAAVNNLLTPVISYIQSQKSIIITPGGGGGWGSSGWLGGSWGSSWAGGAGGHWGWCVILEVLWNLTLWTTTLTFTWTNGSNAAAGSGGDYSGGGGGWGGGGGTFICLYSGTLSWTSTPTVTAWSGWAASNWNNTRWGGGWGAGGNWYTTTWTSGSNGGTTNGWAGWAGWVGSYLIEKNNSFL